MLEESLRKRIENATVTFLRKGGQGVLVSGGLILTAAHVIDYEGEEFAKLFLGEHCFEEIETVRGNMIVTPWAVEAARDIAALGCADIPELFKESLNYEAFCENTEPIPLAIFRPSDFDENGELTIDVFIYTHEAKWVKAKALLYNNFPHQKAGIWIEAGEPIRAGTSGSPIVSEKGELIGLVSMSIESPPFSGTAPRVSAALPAWILDMIMEFEKELKVV